MNLITSITDSPLNGRPAASPSLTNNNTGNMRNNVDSNGFLPDSFEPNEKEVILGRGKQVGSHPGNLRFKEIVLAHIEEYSAAQTKALKTSILSQIVKNIRDNSEYKAGFVKQDMKSARWTIAEDSAARIATAQVFRDALHENYKSSKVFKQQRRNNRKNMAKKQREMREAITAQQGSANMQGFLPPLTYTTSSAAVPTIHPLPLQLRHQQMLTGQQQMQQQQWSAKCTQRQAGGAQDQIAGHLSTVLASCTRRTSDSLSSYSEASAALPNVPAPGYGQSLSIADPSSTQADNDGSFQPVNINNIDTMSILYNHFGVAGDDSTDPFEPTPISEEANTISETYGRIPRQL